MNKIRLRYITLCILMLSAITPARGQRSAGSNIVSCQLPGGGIVGPIQLEDEITTFDYCGRSAFRDAFEATWRKKELDRMHGLDWYDSSARYYDHVLGRFHQVDPLAEKYYAWSPYAYCMGNPVGAINPDGRKLVFVNGYLGFGSPEGGETYWNGHNSSFVKGAQSTFNDYATPYFQIVIFRRTHVILKWKNLI